MNVSFNLVISIILEILFIPFLTNTLILIFFIINMFFITNNLIFLFSKNKEKNIVLNEKYTFDDFKEILQINDINKQVDVFFKNFNLDVNFLNKLLENFTEEHRIEFIETLIFYCRNKLSNNQLDFLEKQYTITTLSLAIKYKNKL